MNNSSQITVRSCPDGKHQNCISIKTANVTLDISNPGGLTYGSLMFQAVHVDGTVMSFTIPKDEFFNVSDLVKKYLAGTFDN